MGRTQGSTFRPVIWHSTSSAGLSWQLHSQRHSRNSLHLITLIVFRPYGFRSGLSCKRTVPADIVQLIFSPSAFSNVLLNHPFLAVQFPMGCRRLQGNGTEIMLDCYLWLFGNPCNAGYHFEEQERGNKGWGCRNTGWWCFLKHGWYIDYHIILTAGVLVQV